MKHLHVACAIIEKNGLVLVTQRSQSMSMPLKWEFPGGKIDSGESALKCLERELNEELSIHVHVNKELEPSTFDYPLFRITLYPFVCSINSGDLTLHEHSALSWLEPHQLYTLDWAEADIPVLDSYIACLNSNECN